MKTGNYFFNPERSPSFKIIVSRVFITMKFPCRLFLEYHLQEEVIRSREIRIEPKERGYVLEEEILGEGIDQAGLVVSVRLLSSKGVSFTAGLMNLHLKDLDFHCTTFKVPLTKALDPSSYCECRCIQSSSVSFLPQQKDNEQLFLNSSLISFQAKQQALNDQKSRIKSLELQLQTVKTQFKLFKMKDNTKLNPKDPIFLQRQLQKYRSIGEEAKNKSKQISGKVQFLEGELYRVNLNIERQKEIISMLESAQKRDMEERMELKIMIKAQETDLEEKRTKIRELEGERMNFLMGDVTAQKEIGFLRQRIQDSIGRTYNTAMKLMKVSTVNDNTLNPKFASFSCEGWPRQCDDSIKLATKSHKYLFRSQLPWQDQSQAFKQQQGSEISSSSAMNEISISHINTKCKQEVSLLNSDLFPKAAHSRLTLGQNLRTISDFVRGYCLKIQRLLVLFSQQSHKEIQQWRFKCREMRDCNSQFQKNQQSLLNHLDQLEGGLEDQLTVAAEKEKALNSANQYVRRLEQKIEQEQETIRGLESQVNELEEEKEQLKSQIHQKDYQYAVREEQLMMTYRQHQASPAQKMTLSPRVKMGRREKRMSFAECDHEREIVIFREQIKTLELELSHEKRECRQLKLNLESVELERHKQEFAMKLRERMQMLNESMEISREGSQEDDGTKESRGEQLQQFTKVLAD